MCPKQTVPTPSTTHQSHIYPTSTYMAPDPCSVHLHRSHCGCGRMRGTHLDGTVRSLAPSARLGVGERRVGTWVGINRSGGEKTPRSVCCSAWLELFAHTKPCGNNTKPIPNSTSTLRLDHECIPILQLRGVAAERRQICCRTRSPRVDGRGTRVDGRTVGFVHSASVWNRWVWIEDD